MRRRQVRGTAGRWWSARATSVRSDRGATALEYVGAVIVAVSIVLALIATGVTGSIGERFRCAISSVWGDGGCSSGGDGSDKPQADAEFEPPLCTLSTLSDKGGSEVKIGFLKLGNEYGFKEQVVQSKTDINGDGKVDAKDQQIYMTFTDAASAGAAFGFGGKIGKLGTGEVELGAGIKVNNGDTWVFNSQAEADKFRDDLNLMQAYQEGAKYGGGLGGFGGGADVGGMYDAYKAAQIREKLDKQLKNRHITYGSIGAYGEGDGELSIGQYDDRVVGAKINGEATINADVIWTKNDVDNTKSYTYSVKGSGLIGGKVSAGGFETGDHATGERTATITVTRDQKSGKLVRIDFTQTTETATGSSNGYGTHNGKEGKDKKDGNIGDVDNSGGSKIQVYTNTLTFGGPEDDAGRAIAQNWLDGNGGGAGEVFAYLLSNNAPTSRPGADDPFGRLLFDKGKSSKTAYDGDADAHEYGFELNLGLSIGASLSLEKKSETLKNAEFLGAPRNGTRRYVPYSYCAN